MDKKLIIKYKKTSELIPYAMNSRTHNEQQVGQIAASIKAFGFTNPVLLDGDNGIIAGHGRVMAAQKLNLDQVPTIELSHFDENQKRAYVITDNKLALNAGWDSEFLASEIQTLEFEEFDLSLLGFTVEDLARLADDQDLAKIQAMADVADEDDLDDIDESDKADKPKQELYPLSVMLDHDQREVVFAALKKAKRDKQLENSSQAIWFICKEYINE